MTKTQKKVPRITPKDLYFFAFKLFYNDQRALFLETLIIVKEAAAMRRSMIMIIMEPSPVLGVVSAEALV